MLGPPIDAGGVDPHQDLARSRRRDGNGGGPQHGRVAITILGDGRHGRWQMV